MTRSSSITYLITVLKVYLNSLDIVEGNVRARTSIAAFFFSILPRNLALKMIFQPLAG